MLYLVAVVFFTAGFLVCAWLTSSKQPEPPVALPAYTTEIGQAGEDYLKSVSLDGRYRLSGMFRWHELWDAMCIAAMKAGSSDSANGDRNG